MSAAPIKGRGAASNPANRFDGIAVEPDPDWEDDEPSRPETVVLADASKTIISYNDSPDVGFNAGINPYRGCEHGCIYCYARPFHEYLGMSAGLDFETKIVAKLHAPEMLRRELAAKSWTPQTIALSGATDCYQPLERKYRLTRGCLEVFAEFRNPVGVITKNRLVTRDIDVLQRLAEYDAVCVFLSVTTLDVPLNRVLEPRTSLPNQRLDAIRRLSAAGIRTGVMIGPVIPCLTDHEIPAILEAAAEAGARSAGYNMLRLPLGVAALFEEWLRRHYPDRADKVLNRVRSMHGGELYKPGFGGRMRGAGLYAEQTRKLFSVTARRHGMNFERFALNASHFRRPGDEQLALL